MKAGAGKPPAQPVRRVTSMVAVSYRRSPVGHADRTDRDLHVCASGFFVEVVSSRNRQVVELTNDDHLFGTHGFHFFATRSQPHHFSSTRLRLSHSSRAWPGDYEDPGRSPNVYSYYQLRYVRQVRPI